MFYDRLLQQDAAGKTTSEATQRTVAIVAAVKSRATGKPAFAVLRVLNPNPDGVPGFYRKAVLADVDRATTFGEKALEPGVTKDE